MGWRQIRRVLWTSALALVVVGGVLNNEMVTLAGVAVYGFYLMTELTRPRSESGDHNLDDCDGRPDAPEVGVWKSRNDS